MFEKKEKKIQKNIAMYPSKIKELKVYSKKYKVSESELLITAWNYLKEKELDKEVV